MITYCLNKYKYLSIAIISFLIHQNIFIFKDIMAIFTVYELVYLISNSVEGKTPKLKAAK